jgi:hypothetical protein
VPPRPPLPPIPEVDRFAILTLLDLLICTSWRATHEIARALPEAFVPNSVVTTFPI